jgi:hypothetical protein
MKREDLARKLAQETRPSSAKRATRIDALVRKILKSLRAGKPRQTARHGKTRMFKTNQEDEMKPGFEPADCEYS